MSLVHHRRWLSRLQNLHSQKKQILFFCTTNHNKKHTQALPPPIRVALTESAGRGVFATRRIGAGDLIHTAKPILTHPSLSVLDTVCYFCLRKIASSSSCFQDHTAVFCSEECKEKSKVQWVYLFILFFSVCYKL